MVKRMLLAVLAAFLLFAVVPAFAAETVDVRGDQYEFVNASATAQVMGNVGGAGDIFVGLLIIPATTSPGAVSILDGSISKTVFTGGAASVATLHPFFVPLNAVSQTGPWKVTTGTNVSVVAVGTFR